MKKIKIYKLFHNFDFNGFSFIVLMVKSNMGKKNQNSLKFVNTLKIFSPYTIKKKIDKMGMEKYIELINYV